MNKRFADLADYCNPSRFEEIARLHTNALNWKPQGRIPLGIHVNNPEHTAGLDYGEWLNPEPFFDAQLKALCDTFAVGSDLMPHVAINHLGDTVVASMFGAELFVPKETSATLQDVGPTPLPVFDCIDDVAELEVPALDAGIVPEVQRLLRFYRERLPEWIHLVTPMPCGPFSVAMELRGMDIIYDLVDQPDLCRQLIEVCALSQIQVERAFRAITGTPLKQERHVTNFGILGAGRRMGDDSLVNLSPAMIHDFCEGSYRLANDRMGGRGHIHFCSLPHSRFEHVYPVLAESEHVSVVSSQFGFEYYQEHVDALRGRLAVETFYGDAYAYVCQEYGSFAAWANEFVPRYKDEAGLVMYLSVPSVEEGREVWAAWQEAHGK